MGVLLFGALPAFAQAPRLEVGVGVGFASAEGDPPPALPMASGGLVVWFNERFGMSWSASFGPRTEDQPIGLGAPADFPRRVGDRKIVSSGQLFLARGTFRYRRQIWRPIGVVLGGGLLVNGGYSETYVLAESLTQITRHKTRERWGGFSYEALIHVRLVRRLTVQTGIVTDFALDRFYYQPTVQVAVGLR